MHGDAELFSAFTIIHCIYSHRGGVLQLKMDIYRKRQIGAAVILVLLILIIVLAVRCTSSVIRNAGNDSQDVLTEEQPEEPETEDAVPEEETEFAEEVKPETMEYREQDSLPFSPVEIIPEDVSLINDKYISDICIVGDSICKGYSVYGRLKEDNVLAVGSVGIRNVLQADFEYQGYKLKLTDILGRKKPKYIFISLGMNDVNLVSEEQYISDYRNLISEIQQATPTSYIIPSAITPVSRQTDFTQNDKIDTFNENIRKMVYDYNSSRIFYLNAARYLKGEDNFLIPSLSSGDGIHLASDAYDYLITYMLYMLDWI